MWLLDHNLPKHLVEALKNLGVDCDTTKNRGWDELENGNLVSAAVACGFNVILTRDRLFREQAAKTLKQFSSFAIVVITLPQQPGPDYVEAFKNCWKGTPIQPIPGRVITWPSLRKVKRLAT